MEEFNFLKNRSTIQVNMRDFCGNTCEDLTHHGLIEKASKILGGSQARFNRTSHWCF